MKFNILEYIGKVKDGVMTLITLEYNGVYYDATFYYTNDLVTLTIDDKLIDVMGHDIEDYENYDQLILNLLKQVVPYNEIITRLDEIEY